MSFKSSVLAGSTPNTRLERAAIGPPSIKPAPPVYEVDAIRRIQRALVILLKRPLPLSFPDGPDKDPDGKYEVETYRAVIEFQKSAFPTDPMQRDGRVGKNTLGKMDVMLPPVPPAPATDPRQESLNQRADPTVWVGASFIALRNFQQFLRLGVDDSLHVHDLTGQAGLGSLADNTDNIGNCAQWRIPDD